MRYLDYEIKEDILESSKTLGEDGRKVSEDIAFIGARPEALKIYEFLKKLNGDSTIIAKTIQEFESFYFSNLIQLRKDEIKQLFWGTAKLRGLLHFCGDPKTYIGGTYCLQFLSKLFKYEYNAFQTEKFIDVFSKTDPLLIKHMNLDHYIKEITTLDGGGLLILFYYLKYNPHNIGKARKILEDPKSIEEYEKWMQNKIIAGYLFKDSLRKSSSLGSISDLKTRLGEQEDSKEELSDVFSGSLGEAVISNWLIESSYAASVNSVNYLTNELDEYPSWDFIDSLSTDSFKAFSKGDKYFRLTIQIQTPDYKAVIKHFYDLESRAKWDPLYWNIIKNDSEKKEIAQIMVPQTGGEVKFVEYIVMRSLEVDESDESAIITERSLILPKSSLSYVKRVHVNACIWRITNKIDIESQKYVECQVLWAVDEGFINLAQSEILTSNNYKERLNALSTILNPKP